MPITKEVMKQIKKWAVKDHAQKGLIFKNRNSEEYKFGEDNNKDTPTACPEVGPFPDISAEAPGILTKHKEIKGVNSIQDEPLQSDKEQALLATENSGLKFGPIDISGWQEVIELLNENVEEALNNFFWDDVVSKIKKMRDDVTRKIVKEENEDTETDQSLDGLRRSGRERIPTKKCTNYKLYLTVSEEDEFLLATNGDKSNDGDNGDGSNGTNNAQIDSKALSAVAYYVMVHYAERKCSRSKRRGTSPNLGNMHWMLDLGSLAAEVWRLSQRTSISSTLTNFWTVGCKQP